VRELRLAQELAELGKRELRLALAGLMALEWVQVLQQERRQREMALAVLEMEVP
jgi:hypothetical protein